MGWLVFIACLAIFSTVQGTGRGFGPGDQDYGYVTVREGAHVFWWLYHTTANVTNSADRPLVIWLQGGPGVSATGYANFKLIGPLDVELNPRDETWVKDFNVLFVDSPVGVGYSYVDNPANLNADNQQLCSDLITVMKAFYEKLPQFRTSAVYVFGHSYAGKMAVEFTKNLYEENQAGNIQANVQGVGLLNGWVDSITTTLAWAPQLYQMSLIDRQGEQMIMAQANKMREVFLSGDYFQATEEWFITEYVIFEATDGVDFYNLVNKVERPPQPDNRSIREKVFSKMGLGKYSTRNAYSIEDLMNGPVKEALGIPSQVEWVEFSEPVFDALAGDFMKPVNNIVESLLNETTVQVAIINGNMDLIVGTPGQMAWVDKLKWPQAATYKSAPRNYITANNLLEGYRKTAGKFSFYWANVAGHNVPTENPAAMRFVLRTMTGI